MPPPRRRQNRQSCDRCHAHKLRCPKQSGSVVCTRCSKAGAACVYSPVGTLPLHQDLSATSDNPHLPHENFDWGIFSFDQFTGPTDLPNPGAPPFDEATETNIPLGPRAQCFHGLYSMAVTLNKAMSGLPPVAKFHVSSAKMKERCLEISEHYSIKNSLEVMLNQTQNLVDMYPETVRLALEHLPNDECCLADCIHTYESHPDLDEDHFETAAHLATKVDYPLLKLLLSCHYQCADMMELVLCHTRVCVKSLAAAKQQGDDPHQFEVPELRMGSFIPSPRFSPSIVTAILIDLQSSLAGCVSRLTTALKQVDQGLGKEGRIILLECDLVSDRAHSIVESLKKLRELLTKSGVLE
ncbi:Transcription factor ACEII [Colletotrichum tanaceti]|nr:Transcription factor ACEII [Colletotrichum tanaceti]